MHHSVVYFNLKACLVQMIIRSSGKDCQYLLDVCSTDVYMFVRPIVSYRESVLQARPIEILYVRGGKERSYLPQHIAIERMGTVWYRRRRPPPVPIRVRKPFGLLCFFGGFADSLS